MKSLLLTGFGPFADNAQNPTKQIINDLDGEIIGNFEIKAHILSVSYKKAPIELIKHIQEEKPDIIINLGLASDRDKITPELIAINYINSKTADNDGEVIQNSPINSSGDDAIFSSLPLNKILAALAEKNIESELSTTAGTYVCNLVMYSALDFLKKNQIDSKVQSGFIHIPANVPHRIMLCSIKECILSLD